MPASSGASSCVEGSHAGGSRAASSALGFSATAGHEESTSCCSRHGMLGHARLRRWSRRPPPATAAEYEAASSRSTVSSASQASAAGAAWRWDSSGRMARRPLLVGEGWAKQGGRLSSAHHKRQLAPRQQQPSPARRSAAQPSPGQLAHPPASRLVRGGAAEAQGFDGRAALAQGAQRGGADGARTKVDNRQAGHAPQRGADAFVAQLLAAAVQVEHGLARVGQREQSSVAQQAAEAGDGEQARLDVGRQQRDDLLEAGGVT